jgi:phosphomannomutase
MAEKLIISISGMRGIVGENLTAAIAAEYGSAFGTYLKNTQAERSGELSVCIGRDSRPSGQMLTLAVAAGLCGVGIDVIDLGIVTTPGVGIMVRELGYAGGVMITASHNPMRYNGIKLLLGNGVAPPKRQAEEIRQCYFDKVFCNVGSTDCGRISINNQTAQKHISRIISIIDKQLIASKRFKVVLDSVNGAGGPITKQILAELGCEVIAINDEPSGFFAHSPEPTYKNLTGLCGAVKSAGADMGFAQDPDADRLAIVDENGTYIGEEYSLALAAKYIFSKQKGTAAANFSTSRMIDDIARQADCKVYRMAVGEANVAEAMVRHNCIIGGEGNGGVIDLRVGPIRDSLVGIGLVLQLMAETGKSISSLVDQIGGYYMSKDKFRAEKNEAEKILKIARQRFADAEINTTDGCRFDFADGWLHLRQSNTEPVMRIIVEAKDKTAAQKYIDVVLDIRKEIAG